MSQLKQNFILTKDEATAKQLTVEGFHLISQENGIYKFINQPPKNYMFDSLDMNKICFTNMLSL